MMPIAFLDIMGFVAGLTSMTFLIYAAFFLKKVHKEGEISIRASEDSYQNFESKIKASDVPELFKVLIASEFATVVLMAELNRSSAALTSADLTKILEKYMPKQKFLQEQLKYRLTSLKELGFISARKIKSVPHFALTEKGSELYAEYNKWVKQTTLPTVNELMGVINTKLEPLPRKYDISIIGQLAFQLSELTTDIEHFSYNGCRNWVHAFGSIRQFVILNLADPRGQDLRAIHESEYRFFYAEFNKFLVVCSKYDATTASDNLAHLHQKVTEYQELYNQLKRSELELGQTSSDDLFMEKHKGILRRVFYQCS